MRWPEAESPVTVNEHLLGSHVPVDIPLRVKSLQLHGEAHDEWNDSRPGERLPEHHVEERGPLCHGRNEVVPGAILPPRLEDGHHPRT